MEKHMAGLNVDDLMIAFKSEAKDVNTQQFLKGYAYLPAIIKHQPEGKWALVALRKVSFYDTLEEARTVLNDLPVQGAIYPPKGMKTEDIPKIPGFGIAEFGKSETSKTQKTDQ